MLIVLVGGSLLARQLIQDTVRSSAAANLQQTSEYFIQQLGVRAGELVSAVDVLVADFGFREAISSQDHATVLSALENQTARIGADHAIVRLNDGRLIAAGGNAPPGLIPGSADDAAPEIVITSFSGIPYLVVSTAMGGPASSAQISLAFSMGADFIGQLRSLIGADITLLMNGNGSDPVLLGSMTLPSLRNERQEFTTTLSALTEQAHSFHIINGDAYISLRPALAGTEGVEIFLHQELAAEADTFGTLATELLALVAAAVLLVLILSSWLSKRMTRPLRDIAQLAGKISAGDYQVNLPRQSLTEFAELGNAFTSMQKAISDRETEIVRQAHHDALTGLPNRLAALEFIASLTRSPPIRPFTLLVVDIHHLREINESFGQHAGDTLLRWLGTTLSSGGSRDTRVFRLASDDFLVVQPRSSESDALVMARRLEQITAAPVQVGDHLATLVHLHVGVALAPQHGSEPEQLVQHAEQAMYLARDRRSDVEVYNAAVEATRKRRIALSSALQEALIRNQITLQFQPRIEFGRPLEVIADVQLHWEHPDFGEVSGQELLPLIGNAGLASEFNSWLLENSCAVISGWQKRHVSSMLSIDILAQDLKDPAFVSRILDVSQRYAVHRSLLCIEITESLAMNELAAARDVIARLRRQQIRVAISHFGTGRASLALLREIEVDELRIDSAFISNLARSKADQAIVESIIDLGHRLGLHVCADGVDSRETLNLLEKLGIDGIQGMMLGRTMSQPQFDSWRESWIAAKKRSMA
jgi:diguanylate cyclase